MDLKRKKLGFVRMGVTMSHDRVIWIIEDDAGCQFVYEEILSIRYKIKIFSTFTAFKKALNMSPQGSVRGQGKGDHPDLVILDLRLPGEYLLHILSSQEGSIFDDLSFLVVSSVDDIDALRLCFERGALDYITKPFSKNELIVKVERCLKGLRADRENDDEGELILDPTFLTAKRHGIIVSSLTTKEMQILSLLKNAPHQTVLRQELMLKVWGGVSVSSKTLDVHIFNLRKKIIELGVEIRYLPPNSYTLIPKEGHSRQVICEATSG